MKHTLSTFFSFDGENDAKIEILYNFTAGTPERGPSYDSGGQPAESDEIEVIGVLVENRTATEHEFDCVADSERLYNEMVVNALDKR